MENAINLKQKDAEKTFNGLVLKLDALSPLKTMTRGFSIIEKDNQIVKSSKDLNVDDEISVKFIDGSRNAKIM